LRDEAVPLQGISESQNPYPVGCHCLQCEKDDPVSVSSHRKSLSFIGIIATKYGAALLKRESTLKNEGNMV
jgi:hypothetical protein